jgi:hypothetical protein
MAIYKTKWFDKWALKNNLVNTALCKAAEELDDDLYDASLGGSVYKKRVAIANRGKSGGVRTLIAFRKGENIFFMYGFAKNQQANIKVNELKALKLLAKQLLSFNEQELAKAVNAAELIEVVDDE